MARAFDDVELNEFDDEGNWVDGPFHPNRQTKAEPEEAADEEPESNVDVGFDPGEFNIEDVVAYVEANPDEREAVLAAEQAGKARTTLLAQLQE